jgi:hypothetical protein
MADRSITYKSTKSHTEYTVTEKNGRAHLSVSGEASNHAKVMKQINDVRRGGCSFELVCWMARQLSQTF